MDGDSWDESFKTIKQALERAIASDEISAREGSYAERVTESHCLRPQRLEWPFGVF